jgi:hypothetical protein
VTRVEIDNAISAGIHLRQFGLDTIPVYEEHIARLERGIRLSEWATMPEDEKALVVALRRVQKSIENIQNDTEIRQAKKKMKKGSKGK